MPLGVSSGTMATGDVARRTRHRCATRGTRKVLRYCFSDRLRELGLHTAPQGRPKLPSYLAFGGTGDSNDATHRLSPQSHLYHTGCGMAKVTLRAVLAENIRAYRARESISQDEFAAHCGVHRTYVGSVERCERNVTLATLELFAKAMATSVPALLTKGGGK